MHCGIGDRRVDSINVIFQVALAEMQSSAKQLALSEVFAEDSEHERTFDGFSDSDIDGDGHQVRHVVYKCTWSEVFGSSSHGSVLFCFVCLF